MTSGPRLVVSPRTTLTWLTGEVVVSRPGARHRLLTADSAILELLQAFAVPRRPDEVVGLLGDVSSTDVREAIGELLAEGMLVPAVLSRDDFMALLEKRRRDLDFLFFEDQGKTVSNCGKERLSPGCRSCKEGRWICVFPTLRCNADCAFCPRSPDQVRSSSRSERQWWLDDFLLLLSEHAGEVTGISISGGELFLGLAAARRLLQFIGRHLPHVYTWAYTNGIAATGDRMQELRDLGLQEIRFNLAASGFSGPVMEHVAQAVRIFPWVSVEVPSCQETHHHLLAGGVLAELDRLGVKQLNLAELIIPRHPSNATRTYRSGRHELYEYTSAQGSLLSPVHSRLLTYDVLEHGHRHGIGLPINDCSNEAKHLQELRQTSNGLATLAASAGCEPA